MLMVGGLLLLPVVFNLVHGCPSSVKELYSGELRPYTSQANCLGGGLGGDQYLHTLPCEGYGDDLYAYCEDLTIRSSKYGTCLQAGDGFLKFHSCDTSQSAQLWDISMTDNFSDSRGIQQTSLVFRTHLDETCLYGPVHDKKNEYFESIYCENTGMNFFFFRSKGQLHASGWIHIQEAPSSCLTIDTDDPSNDKRVQVRVSPCSPSIYEQEWDYWESGELVSKANGCCVTYRYQGILNTGPCDYDRGDVWSLRDISTDGVWFSIESSPYARCFRAGLYRDGSDIYGEVKIVDCDFNSAYEKFGFADWTPTEELKHVMFEPNKEREQVTRTHGEL